jgi:hypothetical protein
MRIVPYAREHLLKVQVQPAQMDAAPWITPEVAAELEGPNAWSVLVDGEPVFCGGAWDLWQDRALVWAILSKSAGPVMPRITRGVLRYLQMLPHRRVEAYVDAAFPAGVRWARMLGFVNEGKMTAFLPTGADAYMFARVK